jgi:hypothetical protein
LALWRHYSRETLGELALGEVIGGQFDVAVEFLDPPNEI